MQWPDFLQYEGRQCHRAWQDTLDFFSIKKRSFTITVVTALIGWPTLLFLMGWERMKEEVVVTVALALLPFGVIFVGVLVRNLFLTPSRMEMDAKEQTRRLAEKFRSQLHECQQRIVVFEEERIPRFAVKAFPRKPALYERSDHTAWADLEIKNTSPSVDLVDVSVQIVEAVLVLEKQEKPGLFFLHEPTDVWAPSNVLWSGINGPPREYSRTIHPQEKQYATIAHHTEHSGAGAFNTIKQSPVYGNKIVIEVSSSKMNTWKGEFYIEYHPARRDEFEFEEWDSWCKSHQLIESTSDTGDSQKQ